MGTPVFGWHIQRPEPLRKGIQWVFGLDAIAGLDDLQTSAMRERRG
jgi:hypothetical protein